MKSAAMVSCTLLIGTVLSSSAQTAEKSSGAPPPKITVYTIPFAAPSCPVSLRAQQGASGTKVQTDRSRPKGMAQLLHLTLIDPHPESQRIVSARLRVSGLAGAARVTQTLSTADEGNSVQTLDITFSPETEKQVSGDLWVPAMTAVLSINLESVTYGDGSRRVFSSRDACHVTPDPLMLVSAH